jgi:hypothetical protein
LSSFLVEPRYSAINIKDTGDHTVISTEGTTAPLLGLSANPFKGNSFKGNRPTASIVDCKGWDAFRALALTCNPPVLAGLVTTPRFSLFSSLIFAFRGFCRVTAANAPADFGTWPTPLFEDFRIGELDFSLRMSSDGVGL